MKKDTLQKLGFDKLALLGMLVLALFIARLITESKTSVSYTEPVKLKRMGLSVPLPMGNGWQTKPDWVYQGSSFKLTSAFNPNSPVDMCVVMCTYSLTATDTSNDEFFREKANQAGSIIVDRGNVSASGIILDWAEIRASEDSPTVYYLARSRVGKGHRLIIELIEKSMSIDFAEDVFFTMLESLEYERPGYFETSEKFLGDTKAKSMENFAYSSKADSQYILKSSDDQYLGFSLEKIGLWEGQDQRGIAIESYFFVKEPLSIEKVSRLEGEFDLSAYTWKTQHQSSETRKSTLLEKENPDFLAAESIQYQPSGEKRKVYLSSLTLPDIVLNAVLFDFVESGQQELYLDVIDSDGYIVPVYVTKRIPTDIEIPIKIEPGSVCFLELLNEKDNRQLVSFGRNYMVKQTVLYQDRVYILERTEKDFILDKFPEQEHIIKQKMQNGAI